MFRNKNRHSTKKPNTQTNASPSQTIDYSDANLLLIKQKWAANCIQYLQECLAGQHLVEAINDSKVLVKTGEFVNSTTDNHTFSNDAEVIRFLNSNEFKKLNGAGALTRNQAFQQQFGDPSGIIFTPAEIIKYRAFLYYAGNKARMSSSPSLTDLLSNYPPKNLAISTKIRDMQKHVDNAAEQYLSQHLNAKSILSNLQNELDNQNFSSGKKIRIAKKIGTKKKIVPTPIEKIYSYIDQAVTGRGYLAFNTALCKSVETIVVAEDHRKKSRNHNFYKDMASDLTKTFNLDVDESIKSILNYINHDEHETKWSFIFKKSIPSEIKRIKKLLESASNSSSETEKQEKLKKALVLNYDSAKKISIYTSFTERFLKNMSTLLVFHDNKHWAKQNQDYTLLDNNNDNDNILPPRKA